MESAHKKARLFSGREAIALALARISSASRSTKEIPQDIWEKILIETEITDVLSLATVEPITRLLYDDTFWRKKFLRDFSDFTDIMGPELPPWIIPNDELALPEFRQLPWRRYYNVIRYCMKKVHADIVKIVNYDQNAFARANDTGFHPFLIDASLKTGSIHSVSVEMYARKEGQFFFGKGDNLGSDVYTIWEFCQKFVLTKFDHSNGDDLDQFYKSLDTINTLRIWLRNRLYHSGFEQEFAIRNQVLGGFF